MVKKIWEVWEIEDKIGSGSFGEVYKAHKRELGKDFYAAVKHISLPKNQDEIKEVISEGYATTNEGVLAYYQDTIDDLVKEIKIMYELRANTNIVDYQDHLITEKSKGKVGFDIYIRMELLESLDKYIENKKLNEEDIIKIGKDICNALITCDKHNLLHRDIKPANIFVDNAGNYKLGDFGVARKLEKTTYGMSKKGTYNYMSPEIYKGEMANISSDIYSLGIVMYRLLNNNKAPFIDKNKKTIKVSDSEEALMKRMSGEELPDIDGVSDGLMCVIKKATAFNKKNRYHSPSEMYDDLDRLSNGQDVKIEDSLDKTISIYGEDSLDKTISIYSKEKQLEDVNEYTTDDELRDRIRRIMAEEQNNIKDKVKYITIKKYKEKSFILLKIVAFILCLILFFLNISEIKNFMHDYYNKYNIINLYTSYKTIFKLIVTVDLVVLISYIISLFSRKSQKISSYGYLINVFILISIYIYMQTNNIRADISYFLFLIINFILYTINYKWKLKVVSDEVEEKNVEWFKEKDKKLEVYYKKSYINKYIRIASIIIFIIVCIFIYNINNSKLKSQSNEINSNMRQIKIVNDFIRIRKNADIKSDIIGFVYKDEIYTVLDEQEKSNYKWYHIETYYGLNGYIRGDEGYLTIISEGSND